jgi:hypothetical protein
LLKHALLLLNSKIQRRKTMRSLRKTRIGLAVVAFALVAAATPRSSHGFNPPVCEIFCWWNPDGTVCYQDSDCHYNCCDPNGPNCPFPCG